MSKLVQSPAWQALAAHSRKLAGSSLRGLFDADPQRAQRFALDCGDILLDYSRQRIDAEALRLLLALAEAAQVPAWIQRLFAGERVNNTEDRAALHMALRSDRANFPQDGDVMPAVRAARARMRQFVETARGGGIKGATGRAITDIVNIGIGGSDLGPRMLVRALRRFGDGRLRLHFVANIDPADLEATLAGLSPETTFFIVASKSFTTAETLDNARRARVWLQNALGRSADLARHFAAVTANEAGAAAVGAPPERIFPLWDWVGGRYSVWSAVGLPAALAAGMDKFDELLEGARMMDAHFESAPLDGNLPAILALIEIWNVNFLGARSRVVLPYSEDLRDFPAYLQQLEMESNGKRVDRDGGGVDYATAPVVWGAAGTPGQHSFHQLLHQGTEVVPAEFIVFAQPHGDAAAHAALAANALAQSAALAFGDPAPQAPHKALPGNRPSSVLLVKQFTPRALGQLIALYEHKVFVEGIVWNLDSFDQWGVEHGKRLARTLLASLTGAGDAGELDPATRALLARLRGGD